MAMLQVAVTMPVVFLVPVAVTVVFLVRICPGDAFLLLFVACNCFFHTLEE